tara:strand:- start:54 stop:551 length:498 start_codon:yes stop_codon:yes gene_type:complete
MADNKTVSEYGRKIEIKPYMDNIVKKEGFTTGASKRHGEEGYTMGHGFYGVGEHDTITEADSLVRLEKEISTRLVRLKKEIPNFDKFPEWLRVPIMSEAYRGSIFGSPDTMKLINQGKYGEAAIEFLDNDEYRTAEEKDKAGIIPRMEAVRDALIRFQSEKDAKK